jgi:hypothetical protein
MWEVAVQESVEGQPTYRLLNVSDLARASHNRSTLVIAARTLPYGIYRFKFFARMWDTRETDYMKTHQLPFQGRNETPNCFTVSTIQTNENNYVLQFASALLHPVFHKNYKHFVFQGDDTTFIEVYPTPLKCSFFTGPTSFITRGRGQQLRLEPYLHSYDMDYPEKRVGITFKLLTCKMHSPWIALLGRRPRIPLVLPPAQLYAVQRELPDKPDWDGQHLGQRDLHPP